MRVSRFGKLVPWGVGLAVGLCPGLILAQNNVTSPPPLVPPQTPPAASVPNTLLPPLTTARDAPPVAANPALGPGLSENRVGRPQLMVAEGVVTRVDKPGGALKGELLRFAFDPTQDWNVFVEAGARNLPVQGTPRPTTTAEELRANASQSTAFGQRSKVVEMVVTRNSRVSAFARTADGMDMYGVTTASTPDLTIATASRVNPSAGVPTATNYTNIKPGSYVSVRYRRENELNVVLNVSLVEFPVTPPTTSVNVPGNSPEDRELRAAERGNAARRANPAGVTLPPRPPSTRAQDGGSPGTLPR